MKRLGLGVLVILIGATGLVNGQKTPVPEVLRKTVSVKQLTLVLKGVAPEQVLINNQPRQIVSWPYLAVLPQGRYLVVAKAKGYQDFNADIDLSSDQRLEIQLRAIPGVVVSPAPSGKPAASPLPTGVSGIVTLAPIRSPSPAPATNPPLPTNPPSPTGQPATSQLTIEANVKGAEIFINDQSAGFDVVKVRLAPGPYRIVVRAADYEPQAISTVLQGDQVLRVELATKKGFLELTIPAGASASLWVNGVLQTASRISLTPGIWPIKVQYAGLTTELNVTINANQTLKIRPGLVLVAE